MPKDSPRQLILTALARLCSNKRAATAQEVIESSGVELYDGIRALHLLKRERVVAWNEPLLRQQTPLWLEKPVPRTKAQ